jgi:hypothetical protein
MVPPSIARPKSSMPLGHWLRRFVLVSLCMLSAFHAPIAEGQATTGSALHLTVVSAEDSAPIENAEVLLGGGPAGTTAPDGFIAIQTRAGSVMEMEVRRIGFQTRVLDVAVAEGRPMLLTIPLEIRPVELQGVAATGTSSAPSALSSRLEAFYRRVRTGAGEYITRAEIERRNARNLSDLIRSIPGIRVTSTPGGDRPSLEARRSIGYDLVNPDATGCAIQYFIDGSPIKPIHDGVLEAEIMLHEIEGIEIYRRGATTAAQYQRMNGGCGVVLIWKKDRE